MTLYVGAIGVTFNISIDLTDVSTMTARLCSPSDTRTEYNISIPSPATVNAVTVTLGDDLREEGMYKLQPFITYTETGSTWGDPIYFWVSKVVVNE